MSEQEGKILETFKQAIPHMTELEREKLLAFGEGMAFTTKKQPQDKEDTNDG